MSGFRRILKHTKGSDAMGLVMDHFTTAQLQFPSVSMRGFAQSTLSYYSPSRHALSRTCTFMFCVC